jgi:hypothetical protein
MKLCGKCGETKSFDRFHKWWKGDGYQPWCKDCRRVYDAAYHQRVNPGGSSKRGNNLPGFEKKGNVADFARKHSRRRVSEEIEKCELVCANCHAIRTRRAYT